MTAPNQLGFKRNYSTDMCIFYLNETANYYHALNNQVIICFMHNKSVFDRVSHDRLFQKLLIRSVSCYLLLISMAWYENQRNCVVFPASSA